MSAVGGCRFGWNVSRTIETSALPSNDTERGRTRVVDDVAVEVVVVGAATCVALAFAFAFVGKSLAAIGDNVVVVVVVAALAAAGDDVLLVTAGVLRRRRRCAPSEAPLARLRLARRGDRTLLPRGDSVDDDDDCTCSPLGSSSLLLLLVLLVVAFIDAVTSCNDTPRDLRACRLWPVVVVVVAAVVDADVIAAAVAVAFDF